jgi:hypothetical protein
MGFDLEKAPEFADFVKSATTMQTWLLALPQQSLSITACQNKQHHHDLFDWVLQVIATQQVASAV